MRVALYARYSSDKQSEHSIEDQIALVTKRLAAEGHSVEEVFTDYAISGSSANRPGFQAMLKAVKADPERFPMIAAEALDRLSRNQADIARLYEEMVYLGVTIWTAEEGRVDELHIGLKGTMNALFLKSLKEKIRRGQVGQVKRGKSAGGKAYGYDVVTHVDARGQVERGDRVINEEEAQVVRQIFQDYVAGLSPGAIAKSLNGAGIASPQGGIWRASTINGNRKRGMGFLHNRLYIGELVYNRVRMVKDPETGKRVSRPNPKSEWIIEAVPNLRIIDDETWAKAQARKAQHADRPTHRQRRAKTLLQGLVHCAECGGRYTQKNKDYIYCMNAKEARNCTNTRGIKRAEIEERVLSVLRFALQNERFVNIFKQEFNAALKDMTSGQAEKAKRAEKQIKALDKQIGNIIDAIAEGIGTPAIKQKLIDLSAEREIAEMKSKAPCLTAHLPETHEVLNRYGDIVGTLDSRTLNQMSDSHRKIAIDRIQRMTDTITVSPAPMQKNPEVTFSANFNALISFGFGEEIAKVQRLLVAEEGLEPPTPGL
ncbi:resolvase [Iodidimonas gelatinilytica]|uniref:Resolvase n=1 Tax=Iodidimonas gelatinilytica TaxID=1236966 RepID=A0A5A7N306_9PROT|nr:resolvase [Iodidimonas gelatinilytica]